jgi:hypothetical protein
MHELARRHNLSRNLDLDPWPHALSISAGLFRSSRNSLWFGEVPELR